MIWALVAVVVLVGIFLIGMYNSLVQLRVRCDSAWSDIDVQLKRRHDLIPNLVETVKGYAAHEKGTFEDIAKFRSMAMQATGPADKAAAENQLTGALKSLFAVAENYPQLKANENFLKLQNRISELEERIADRREFFNDDVNTYNIRIAQIPDVFVASFMNLKPRPMFKVSDEDRRQVEVKFASSQGSGA